MKDSQFDNLSISISKNSIIPHKIDKNMFESIVEDEPNLSLLTSIRKIDDNNKKNSLILN